MMLIPTAVSRDKLTVERDLNGAVLRAGGFAMQCVTRTVHKLVEDQGVLRSQCGMFRPGGWSNTNPPPVLVSEGPVTCQRCLRFETPLTDAVQVGFSCSREMKIALEAEADDLGISVGELVRRIITARTGPQLVPD